MGAAHARRGRSRASTTSKFWLDYFRRTKSDAVCLSAGGCVAYYPTKVPFHHRSEWLGDSDPFGELVAGCRKLGMVVIARTDPHAVTTTSARASRLDPRRGRRQPRRHWASPELWVTCALGPYNFEFMTEVKREIVAALQGRRDLHQPLGRARACATASTAARTSRPPPASSCRARTTRRTRRAARTSSGGRSGCSTLWRQWDAEVRKINPDSCVIPNTGGGASSSLDMKRIGELAPTAHGRSPGAPRRRRAVGQREAREGVPRHDGPQADRRHLQRRARGAVPLEGFGAERRRDPPLGDRRHRERPAPVVHEVRRHAATTSAG